MERAITRGSPSGTRTQQRVQALAADARAAVDHGDPSITEAGKGRRLVADQRYFGLEARALRAGLERLLAHTGGAADASVGVEALCESFHLEHTVAAALRSAFCTGGLLRGDPDGSCFPTARLREYASATVVAPLSRARAKILLGRTRELATQINATWLRNPFRIKVIAVTGTYMSRRQHLTELHLSVVLRKRPDMRARRWGSPQRRGEALLEILRALRTQSSFIIVRVVADRDSVQRPFAIVYQTDDATVTEEPHAWERFRSLGVSISRRLGSR